MSAYLEERIRILREGLATSIVFLAQGYYSSEHAAHNFAQVLARQCELVSEGGSREMGVKLERLAAKFDASFFEQAARRLFERSPWVNTRNGWRVKIVDRPSEVFKLLEITSCLKPFLQLERVILPVVGRAQTTKASCAACFSFSQQDIRNSQRQEGSYPFSP